MQYLAAGKLNPVPDLAWDPIKTFKFGSSLNLIEFSLNSLSEVSPVFTRGLYSFSLSASL